MSYPDLMKIIAEYSDSPYLIVDINKNIKDKKKYYIKLLKECFGIFATTVEDAFEEIKFDIDEKFIDAYLYYDFLDNFQYDGGSKDFDDALKKLTEMGNENVFVNILHLDEKHGKEFFDKLFNSEVPTLFGYEVYPHITPIAFTEEQIEKYLPKIRENYSEKTIELFDYHQ